MAIQGKFSEEFYAQDLNAHLHLRLANDRRFVIPWLNATRNLKAMRILEIGCGTGSSTVALAEQGAQVVAIDIDAPALEVARERCRAHGVVADIREANAEKLIEFQPVDAVLYFATLEHMNHLERMRSLADAWSILPVGGLLAIIETPNRLWFIDQHTSRLPFYNWLPDREPSAEMIDHFLRRGRGLSAQFPSSGPTGGRLTEII